MEVAEILALRYPFGREHEASVQLLFRSFCNYIYIGQFECAKACIETLHSEQKNLRYPVKDVLQKVVNKWCTR